MTDKVGLRTGASQNALLAGLTAGLGLLSYDQALAQTTTLQPIPLEGEEQPPAPAPAARSTGGGDGAGQPVAVDVGPAMGDTGNPANTLNASTGTGRLSGDVQGTPQIINVIPKKVLEEQGVTTLDQALRNVPGVTVRIGEGGGGMNGDQFSIRGFEAKGDIYQDGLRDFGVYVRDSFLYEGVQVFKGPSSETFGVGTTGGAINTEVKKAHLGDEYHFESTFGTDPQVRGVIDINKQLGDTSAVRAVLMGNLQDIADRDHTFNDRYGALVDIGTGIGTDTTWNLSYFHQHYDRMPDYGIPILTPGSGTTGAVPSNANPDNPYYSSSDPDRTYAEWAGAAADHISQYGSLGQPATEFGLDRSTFYGKETDKDIGNVHSLTSKFQTELTDWLTVNNDTRLAYYDRDFATSVPGCGGATYSTESTSSPGTYGNATPYDSSCTGSFLNGGSPNITFGGGNPGYYQESWGFQNILSGKSEFETGFLRHELVAGIDFLYQDDDRIRNSLYDSVTGLPSGSKGTQSLLDPDFDAAGYYVDRNPNDLKKSTSANVGIFASDRVWFNDQWSVLAGVRWDYFDVSYDTFSGNPAVWTHYDQQSDFFAPKASLIWEPTPEQTYYLSWATSASVPGQFPTNANATLGSADLEPEENESWELGGKFSVLDGRLGLSGAIFQIDKNNARQTDPVTGDVTLTGEEQRVRGVELGISGLITNAWSFSAAYAYLDSEVLSVNGDENSANVGNHIANAPEHAASLWTTYNLSEHFQQLGGIWLVGGGITYREGVYTSSANTSWIPETFSVDLMTSYEWEHGQGKYRVAVNGYNVTDELNYSGVWGNRVVPASGRTFTLTLGAEF